MSRVIVRCPNCGSTQAALGECEACHHDAVRYHCTNHTPGRWLSGPVCDACGSRYGERVAAAPPAPPRPPPRPPRPPVTLDRPGGARPDVPAPGAGRAPAPEGPREVEEVIVWTPFGSRRIVRPRGGGPAAPPYRGAPTGTGSPWERPARGGGPFGPVPGPPPGTSPGRALVGCVGRTVMLLFLLFVMLAFFLGSMFFG